MTEQRPPEEVLDALERMISATQDGIALARRYPPSNAELAARMKQAAHDLEEDVTTVRAYAARWWRP
jgi:hypothetical protein